MEARVIEKYLPKALSREELEEMVSETLSSVEKKEFGEVMKKVMEKTKGRADGKMVGEIVKSKISDLK